MTNSTLQTLVHRSSTRIARVLFSRNPAYRALLAVNKSPLSHVIKKAVSLRHIKGRRKRRLLASQMSLPLQGEPHLKNLLETGMTKLDDEISAPLLSELESAASLKFKNSPEMPQFISTKSFWASLLDEDIQKGSLSYDNIFVRYALQDTVLGLATRFFGEVPYLSYVFLSASRPMSTPYSQSQLWHRDKDDTRVLKLFTYLSDVQRDEDGPLTHLSRETSRKIRNSFFPRHLTDAEVFRYISKSEIRPVLGPKGTTFLIDTSHCYHMGSRLLTSGHRLMYTAAFITTPVIYPRSQNHITTSGPIPELHDLILRPR